MAISRCPASPWPPPPTDAPSTLCPIYPTPHPPYIPSTLCPVYSSPVCSTLGYFTPIYSVHSTPPRLLYAPSTLHLYLAHPSLSFLFSVAPYRPRTILHATAKRSHGPGTHARWQPYPDRSPLPSVNTFSATFPLEGFPPSTSYNTLNVRLFCASQQQAGKALRILFRVLSDASVCLQLTLTLRRLPEPLV